MNVPYQAIIVGSNEVFKKVLQKRKIELNFSTYFSCACIAGFIASLATMPLDNIRTRMNTQCDLISQISCPEKIECECTKQRQGIIKYTNTFTTAREIISTEGVRGFFKGLVPRSMTQSVSSAISWSTYELVKSIYIGKRESTSH